jgi:two-component system sensor histidine kinase YesM
MRQPFARLGGEGDSVKKHMFLWDRVMLFLCVAAVFVLLLIFTAPVAQTLVAPWLFSVTPICLALFATLLLVGYVWIYRPYRAAERALSQLIEDFTPRGGNHSHLRCPLSRGVDDALKAIEVMQGSWETMRTGRKQAQYHALQNQINPHFLYNTLEGIRGEATAEGMDHIAQMVEILATYFRYTISNTEQLVRLEDELDNIQNYYKIQRYRFGSRIELCVRCDACEKDMLYKCRMPKITLQPIVENAIVHSLERKINSCRIDIFIASTEKRLLITVSDNGAGIEEQRLRNLNQRLNGSSLYEMNADGIPEGRGIALINVNNRIRLLFGEEYGLAIHSIPDVGTDVEISLPRISGRMSQKNAQTGAVAL